MYLYASLNPPSFHRLPTVTEHDKQRNIHQAGKAAGLYFGVNCFEAQLHYLYS